MTKSGKTENVVSIVGPTFILFMIVDVVRIDRLESDRSEILAVDWTES